MSTATTTTDWTASSTTDPRHRRGNGTGSAQGPPLVALAVIFTGLFVGSVVGVGAATGGAHFPSPYDPVATLSGYLAAHHGALVIAALLQFAAAIPMAIFAATVSARMHHLGIRAPGATIALVGGVLASAMLLVSASCQWVLAQPGIRDNTGVARAFQDLAFLTGGPGHVVPLGLLIAGIAVVAAFGHLLPGPLALTGVAIALVAEISTLSVAIHGFAILLPIARFSGYAWLIAAAALLPRTRSRRAAETAVGAA